MNVRAVVRSELPRVSAAVATATRALGASLGVAARFQADLGTWGALDAEAVGFDAHPGGDEAMTRFAVTRPGAQGAGIVEIEPHLALGLVYRALGARPPSTVRRLSPAERGVMAAWLVRALRVFKVDAMVYGEPQAAPASAAGTVVLMWAVSVGETRGVVRVAVPPAWRMGRASLREEAGMLDVVAHVAVARTTLEAADLAEARAGDVLVFDDVPVAPKPESGELTIGRAAAIVTLSGPRVCLQAPLAIIQETSTMPSSPATESATPDEVLAAAPVEVTAEVGRVTLRGDEVLGLRAGSVVTLAGDGLGGIDLVVAGRVWARGELVDVDGALGVRITALVR